MQKNQLYCSTHSWNKDDSLIAITLDMSEHAWPHPFKMTAYICLFYRCLTKFKNSTLYLNSFMRYNSSKNPGFWLVCGFWDHKSRIRFFPDMPFFTPFLGLFGPSWPNKTFLQKLDLVIFLTVWLSNFVQKNQQKLMSQFWDFGFQKDEKQMDRAKFIGHFH